MRIVVEVADLEFDFSADKTNQNENNITYSAVLEYTGREVEVAVASAEYLKIEYSNGGEYSAVIPTVLDRGNHTVYVKVSIVEEYQDRYELEGGYSEYLITLDIELKLIIFDSFQLNGRDTEIEDISYGINKVAKYATMQFTIRERYALVLDMISDNGDVSWTIIEGYYEFLDFDKTYHFYVVDREINTNLEKYADANGVLYEMQFEVNFVNQVIYGINDAVYNNPNGQNVYYELQEDETSFAITLDDESLERLAGFKFSYMIIDKVDGWLDPVEVDSFPLVFDDLSTIRVIMLYIKVGENNNRSILQFTIFEPTHISGYTTTYIELSTGETKTINSVMGYMGETILDAFVVDLEVVLEEEFQEAGYTVGYFADKEYTEPISYTELGLLYVVYFVIYDDGGTPVETGEFYYSHAFIPTNVPALALNSKDPTYEGEYYDWVCVSSKDFALEFAVAEDITITQTYNGEDSLELQEGPQLIDYVLTIEHLGVEYTFAVKFEIIYTPNIIGCFTQEVQQSYVYKVTNTDESVEYYIYSNNMLNHIDISNEYNTNNISDFELVLQELVFPMDSNYMITNKTLVQDRDNYYIKLSVLSEGTTSNYYIKLNVAEAE